MHIQVEVNRPLNHSPQEIVKLFGNHGKNVDIDLIHHNENGTLIQRLNQQKRGVYFSDSYPGYSKNEFRFSSLYSFISSFNMAYIKVDKIPGWYQTSTSLTFVYDKKVKYTFTITDADKVKYNSWMRIIESDGIFTVSDTKGVITIERKDDKLIFNNAPFGQGGDGNGVFECDADLYIHQLKLIIERWKKNNIWL